MSDDKYFEEGSDVITLADMNRPLAKRTSKVDELVSKAVGKTIYTTNPKLIKKLAEWKKAKGDSEEADNWMDDPKKVEELKKIL